MHSIFLIHQSPQALFLHRVDASTSQFSKASNRKTIRPFYLYSFLTFHPSSSTFLLSVLFLHATHEPQCNPQTRNQPHARSNHKRRARWSICNHVHHTQICKEKMQQMPRYHTLQTADTKAQFPRLREQSHPIRIS